MQFFFSSYNVWKHVRYPALISCQPRVIIQFGSSRWYCHSWCYQTAFASRIKRIIYMPDQLRAETILDVNLHFQCAVCNLHPPKNVFTFSLWCYYAFTVTVSYVITQEWWFQVYFLHAENFSLLIKSNLMHIVPRSEDDLRQLSISTCISMLKIITNAFL